MRERIPLPPWAQTLVGILALVATAVTVTVSVVDTNGDNRPDSVHVVVNTAPGDGQPTKTVEVPAPLVDKVAVTEDHAHLDAAPTPAARERVREAVSEDDSRPLPTGGAVIGFKGCVTRILPANYSSRPGVRPIWFVLHYTVSHNVPGWADVNAIIALFSNPARQASSNFVIDAEGHCAYIVPIEAKAWTQAGGNPWSISVEVIAYGDESDYLGPAGWAKLRSVVDQVHRRTGIPLRRGSVAPGCVPGGAGLVQHKDFGLCGGGHVDITPFSVDTATTLLTASAPTNPLTKLERKLVRSACHPKGTGHSVGYWRKRAHAAAQRLDRAHAHGRSWKYHSIGTRRKTLARAAAGSC